MVCFCFIACESAKTEGFLFDSNATTDYLKVEVEGLNKPLVVLTSCTWVKFKDSSPRWEFFLVHSWPALLLGPSFRQSLGKKTWTWL